MNLYLIDWVIVAVLVGALAAMALWCRRYNKGVADFLAANRCGGRYLLTLSEGMAALGAVSVVAMSEQYYTSGFGGMWWSQIMAPISAFIALSGYVQYRFRETRAMTMGQFYEIRYSRRFRIFAGILAWVSGVINYGIFPAVTGSFFVWYCGLPQYSVHLGPLQLDVTLGIVMFILLGIALTFVMGAGQIAVMITDFLQAQFMNVVFFVILIVLLITFGGIAVFDGLQHRPPGESMLNPFDQGDIPDFKFTFFAIVAFLSLYGYMSWQGSQAYSCSAKSPHESRMARVLGTWRWGVSMTMIMLLPLCAFVLLHDPKFSAEAPTIHSMVQNLGADQMSEVLTKKVLVSVSITQMLPPGVLGLFCVVMLAAAISTDDTYLHSWGTLFIQDVYMPLRKNKEPLPPDKHMRLLRRSIVGVAVFAWCFSMIFPLRDYVYMFFQITGAIFIGGAGAVTIGGLYWKRGTTAGAWSALITGSILAATGIFIKHIFWPFVLPALKGSHVNWPWLQNLPEEFPLDGTELAFVTAITSACVYVVVSLLTKVDPDFSMERMLHRGRYAIKTERVEVKKERRGWEALLGITREFTRTDKIIYVGTILWAAFWFFSFLIGTAYCLLSGVKTTDEGWAKWWMFVMGTNLAIGCFTTVWFICGGVRDMKDMFRTLETAKRYALDDGSVEKHHSRIDEVLLAESVAEHEGRNALENEAPSGKDG